MSLALVACTSPTETPSAPADGGADAGVVDAATYRDPPPDGGAITSLSLAPFTLAPAFSPTTFDYSVRCTDEENDATLTTTDALGVHARSVQLLEDQELVVGGTYRVRCLPPDFPTITVTPHRDVGAPTPGYYLLNGVNYAMVLDTNGTPLWYQHGTSVGNVDAPAPNVISFSPNSTSPYGWRDTVRFDVYALGAPTTTSVASDDSTTDAHELRLLPNGDWLLFSYVIRDGVDLTGLGSFGPDMNMADCMVQEIDGQQNMVWSWTASDHVDAVEESVVPGYNLINGSPVVDPFHCNSIDVDGSGNLLISLRHANALFYVDRATGKVEWKLGGTPYNKDGADYIAVTDDPEGAFSLQHDARFTPTGNVTLFDNHGAAASGVARGVEYAIDHQAHTASVVWQFPGPVQSAAEGSFRRYPDGHSVIGWGMLQQAKPYVLTEIDENGDAVLDLGLSGQISYRAIKVPPTQLDIDLLRATAAE
jgi:hypothetical protein